MNIKAQITEQRFLDSLQRLLDGKPQRTKADNKISLSRINKEAGCSHGLIYKYPHIIDEIRAKIENHKTTQQCKFIKSTPNVDKESRLKAARDKQEKLKINYRNQRDNFQLLADSAVKRENELLFRCHELQLELSRINNERVISIHDKQ